MKKVMRLPIYFALLFGIIFIMYGCKSRVSAPETQEREKSQVATSQATASQSNPTTPQADPAAQEVVTQYLQAVLDKDWTKANQLAPNFTNLQPSDLIGTIFHTDQIGDASIVSHRILTSQEFKVAVSRFSQGVPLANDDLNMMEMEKKLKNIYQVNDVIFYEFKVKETSGRKRTLLAYVMALETKTKTWLAGPGINDITYGATVIVD